MGLQWECPKCGCKKNTVTLEKHGSPMMMGSVTCDGCGYWLGEVWVRKPQKHEIMKQ